MLVLGGVFGIDSFKKAAHSSLPGNGAHWKNADNSWELGLQLTQLSDKPN
jgi:hypothetical protein